MACSVSDISITLVSWYFFSGSSQRNITLSSSSILASITSLASRINCPSGRVRSKARVLPSLLISSFPLVFQEIIFPPRELKVSSMCFFLMVNSLDVCEDTFFSSTWLGASSFTRGGRMEDLKKKTLYTIRTIIERTIAKITFRSIKFSPFILLDHSHLDGRDGSGEFSFLPEKNPSLNRTCLWLPECTVNRWDRNDRIKVKKGI